MSKNKILGIDHHAKFGPNIPILLLCYVRHYLCGSCRYYCFKKISPLLMSIRLGTLFSLNFD